MRASRPTRTPLVAGVALLMLSLLPQATFADAPPAPYLFSPDAPYTLNQTVKISFVQLTGDAISRYVLSNSSTIGNDGVLASGLTVSATSNWSLPAALGDHTVHGQVQYSTGAWSSRIELAFHLAAASSAMYVDADPLWQTTKDWHSIGRSPGEQFVARKTPVDSGPPIGFSIEGSAWRINIAALTGSLAPGEYAVGAGVGVDLQEVVGGRTCYARSGSVAVTALDYYGTADVSQADVDFSIICPGGAAVHGSIRYGSTRAIAALDQDVETLSFAGKVGSSTAAKSATFTNFGDAGMDLGSLSLSGEGAADYHVAGDRCSNTTLPVNASCEVSLFLQPTARGARNATLAIPDGTRRGARQVTLRGSADQDAILTLTAPHVPPTAPSNATFVLTMSPIPNGFQPILRVDGSQQFGPSSRVLADPARIEYTYRVTLGAGSHTIRGEYGSGDSILPAAVQITVNVGGDATPPIGTISINGGAEFANSARVTVVSDVADTESAITKIALTSDPTLSWWDIRDYLTASQSWTLDPEHGALRVWAKWMDAAGNWSAVATDAINFDATPAAVSKPSIELIPGSSVTKGKLNLKVSWSATDAGSGLYSYSAGQQTNSWAWSTYDVGGLNGVASVDRSATRVVKPGNTYAFRARARDVAGNLSDWATAGAVKVVAWQEGNTAISYSGKWKSVSSSTYWYGWARTALSNSSTATFNFTGRAIGLVSRLVKDRGWADIYIDGVKVDRVDMYAAKSTNQQIVWSRSWDASATHTIKVSAVVTAARPRVDIDAFVIVQ